MSFEWDEGKRQQNLHKHGIDFVDAIQLWSHFHIEIPSEQKLHGEERFLAIGKIDGRLVTVIFTRRGATRRLISARYSRRNEKENYQNGIG